MYTHVIFDLDGTLLNTIDDLADAGNHVCAAHGWPTHTVDEFKHMVGSGIPKLVERFAPAGTDGEALAGALAEFSAYYDAHKEDKTAPYPGIPELLAALKGQGVRLAVLSNKAHALAGPVVEHYFPGVFDAVQGALPDVPVKPDPTLLRSLMERLGAKPETTLFVGDSDVDVLTGKNGGLTVVGVLWGFRDRRELEGAGADYVIARPEALLAPNPDQRRQTGGQTRALPPAGCVAAWLAALAFGLGALFFYGDWSVNALMLWALRAEQDPEPFVEAARAGSAWVTACVCAVPMLAALALAILLTVRWRARTGGRPRQGAMLAAELLLWAAFGACVWLCAAHLRTAWEAPELWGYLSPERLEDRQLRWVLAGAVYGLAALPPLAGGIALHIIRKRRGKAARDADH